jgi:pimeloyl-ACP methyl ester carboxylesterase
VVVAALGFAQVAQPVSAAPAPRAGTATVAAAATQPGSIQWKPCRDGFQCANFGVPLDHRNPSGERITLRLIRLPAGDPAHRIGSLLMNPGGPGGSGVDFVRAIGSVLPLELRGRFDIVGFDPRGIAESTPLRCFATSEEAISVLAPFAFPYTRAEEEQARVNNAKLAHACATHGGPIRDHMSTADVARDMDLLRAAMGDQKLNYLGYSYGSFLGQAYANLFPKRGRAIAIDAVIDPVAWTTGAGYEGRTLPMTTRLRSDKGAQATLGEFFRLCDAAGANCPFAPNSAERYDAMITRARQAPLVIGTPPDTFTVTYADIVGVTLGALYVPFVWPDLAALLNDVDTGSSPAVIRAGIATLRSGLGLGAAAQEQYPNDIEGPPSVICSDSVNPTAFETWPQAAAEAERQNGYFGRLWTWLSAPCQPWSKAVGQNRYMGPWTKRTASPVLVVGNYFDPATRYQSAVAVSRMLPNSRLLSYAGWGHAAYIAAGNYCIDSAVTRYLVTLKTPAAGTVCEPTSSPFETFSVQAQTRAAAMAKAGGATLPAGVRQALRPRRH